MSTPADFKFTELAHAASERIPFDALDYSTQAIYEVLHHFGEATK